MMVRHGNRCRDKIGFFLFSLSIQTNLGWCLFRNDLEGCNYIIFCFLLRLAWTIEEWLCSFLFPVYRVNGHSSVRMCVHSMQFNAKIIFLTFHCVSFTHKNVGSDGIGQMSRIRCSSRGLGCDVVPKKRNVAGRKKDTVPISLVGLVSYQHNMLEVWLEWVQWKNPRWQS